MIGVLSLQGGFFKHKLALEKLGVKSINVNSIDNLDKCSGLIIPGGESTTISKIIDSANLRIPLKIFAKDKPIFGTCAGMIMIS